MELSSKFLNESLNIYLGKRDKFYYLLVADKSINRDNQLSELFGEEVKLQYYSPLNITEFIYCARFWKDKDSVNRFISYKKSNTYQIKEMNREEFINSIPDKSSVQISDERYIKNLELRNQEIKYSKVWSEYRSKYKCISAYEKVKSPQYWLPCKDCGLIPLAWEFNNGRSTACGCGKNEYVHHSIGAESIMSYVTRNNGSALGFNSEELRMNWNQWVKTGQDVFAEQKKSAKRWDKEIW
jgi:hypothetical protein